MKFTLIVPVYKTEKYLQKCLNTIIEQQYEDFEAILIDDGSADSSSQICDEYSYKDKRIKVIHKKNGGVTSARKAAADIATGDFIICVDSDDWISDVFLLEMSIIIEKYNPDVIVGGRIYVKDATGEETKYNVKGFDNGLYTREKINNQILPLLMGNEDGYGFPGAFHSKVYKRRIFQDAGKSLPNEVTIGEDAAINAVCIYKAATLYISNSYHYYYRYNSGSATRGKRVYSLEEPALIGKYLDANIDMKQAGLQGHLYRSIVHKLFNRCVSQFNRDDSYKTIRNDIDKILSDEFYKECIKHSNFKLRRFWKGFLAQFTLRHRLYRLMQLYSKIR